MPLPIRLVPHRSPFTAEWLASLHAGPVIACDFYVEGAELGRRIPGGYEVGSVVNIDHHSPALEMCRHISSTNLAIERVASPGPESPASLVVISHTDCDSILSSGIMSRELDPDPRFGEAAVAADHTGIEDDIADLLQEVEKTRDIDYCLDSLRRLIRGGEASLDTRAAAALAERRRRREAAREMVARGNITLVDGLGFGLPPEKIDGEFFHQLMPNALVLLLMTRRMDDPAKWDSKIRLGAAAPEGWTLHNLQIGGFDPAFAGRWNAGSNARNGGTSMEPDSYAAELRECLDRRLMPKLTV